MTAVLAAPPSGTTDTASGRFARPLLCLSMLGVGAFMVAAGLALRGSSWILPDGLLGGGVAMLVMAFFARGALDIIVTQAPFMFYTLSPVGGILTVGSSDLLLPFMVGAMVVTAVLGPHVAPERLPTLSAAAPMLVIAAVLTAGSISVWTIADPEFLAKRAIADAVKLGIGVVYFVVVYRLAVTGGYPAAMRAMRIWAWTATGLSLGSLAGITGAVQIIPSDGYRSDGYFEDPNLYAGYLLVSFSVILFLATTSSSWWLTLQGLAVTGGLVTTGSRAGLGSLVLLVVFALVVIRSARLRSMLAAIVSISLLACVWLVVNRGSGTSILGLDRLFFASNDVEDDPRLKLWGRAIEKWLDHPVLGIGLGQFERFSGDAFRVAKSSGLGYVTHNTFLFFLVSFGVVGLALFLWMLCWIVARLYSSPGLSRISKHALMSGVVVLCSQFMTLNLQNLRYVWVYFGLLLALSVVPRPDDDAQDADLSKTLPTRAGAAR
jgi:O-antigen ligase